ncbi:iron-containing alcohol dehydrogenase family protein [Rouxiella sp. WC2420]|uniref:Iron-containing alcohol dehydrogenase family protein n=1 Tax=Rouxiella sp. WC2420 TaxID=3234145 RepID=A0AB39VIW2_9GAMM
MLAIKSPQTYYHKSGIRALAGEYIAPLSKHIAIITTTRAWEAVNPELESSLRAHGIQYAVEFLTGECSEQALVEHTDKVKEQGATLVLGIGGGRVLDTAKGVGNRLDGVSIVTFPTVAATCAAWSPITIIYNEAGGHERSQPLTKMPVLVLVDSEVIARSDVRFLKAGIVDALAKWYEFRPYQQKNADSLALNLKVMAARLAVDTFMAFGQQAVADNQQQRVTPALIKVIDANIAMAGMANSMRDDFPAPGVAHALHNRMTHQPELHHWLHGEKVGFGLLLQSILENHGGEPDAVLLTLLKQFDAPLRLPTLDGNREEALQKMAQEVKFSAQNAARLPFTLSATTILQALKASERAY